MKQQAMYRNQRTFKFNRILIFLWSSIVLILPQSIYGEELKTFSGKIIDAETKEPISLVTVHSPTSWTVTNTDGEYDIMPKQDSQSITFSHISYQKRVYPFNELSPVIELQPKTTELMEVVITPFETLVKELKEVWKKYTAIVQGKKEKDFHVSNYYYRQLTSYDQSYTEYIECFFSAPTSVAVRTMSLQKGRFAKVKTDSVPTFMNYFYNSQITPFTREKAKDENVINTLLCADFEDHYDLFLDRIISSGQKEEVKVYQFSPRKAETEAHASFLSGKLFIRMNDLTIIRAEIKCRSLRTKFQNPDINIDDEDHSFIITYRDNIDTYPIVESVQSNTTISLSLKNKKHVLKVGSTLLATDYILDKKGKRIKSSNILLKEISKSRYDQMFWDNNPVVKRTKTEQQVLEDFNRQGYFGTMDLK